MNPRALHNRTQLTCSFCGVPTPSYEEADAAPDLSGPFACGNCFMKLTKATAIDKVSPEAAAQISKMLATPDVEESDGLDEEEE